MGLLRAGEQEHNKFTDVLINLITLLPPLTTETLKLMPLPEQLRSPHLAALKKDINRVKHTDKYLFSKLRHMAALILDALNRGVAPVDVLRGPDFDACLDPKKNFYELELNITHENSIKILNKSPSILNVLKMSRILMDKKDLWKIFLSTILLELTKGNESIAANFQMGNDIAIDKLKADFVVYGFDHMPRLIVEINGELAGIDPLNMQEMMTSVLMASYNEYRNWPLSELKNLSVYGLIVSETEFQIYRMALSVEKGPKFALLFTLDQRFNPFKLFRSKKIRDQNEFDGLYYPGYQYYKAFIESSEDEDDDCYYYEDLLHGFEELDIKESSSKTKAFYEKNNKATRDKVNYESINKSSVASVIGLMQTILELDNLIQSKGEEFLER